MADRFPSLEEFGDGEFSYHYSIERRLILASQGQTEPKSNGATNGEIDGDNDFLARERALLGDDANEFASSNDHKASAEDDDFDLLGDDSAPAGGQQASECIDQFESSFPAVDTQNNVSAERLVHVDSFAHISMLANGSWRYHHRLQPAISPNSKILVLRLPGTRRRTRTHPVSPPPPDILQPAI